MNVRFYIELKTQLKPGQSKELYDRIKRFDANVIDIGTTVYILGETSYPNLSSILFECLTLGIVECEIFQK